MSFLINRNYFIELSSSLAFNHSLYDFHFHGNFYCRFELRKRRHWRVFINLDIFSVFTRKLLIQNVAFWFHSNFFTKLYTRKISGILWFCERINFAFLSKCVIQTYTPVHKHVYLNSRSTHVYTHLHEDDCTRLRLQLCVKNTWSILNEHKSPICW